MATVATPTILVVDDYQDAVDLWEVYLRHAGFAVITASDGLLAFRIATERRPDLAVLDLELPGMSGYEVAERLRTQAATSHMPLIAATGFSHAAQLDRARRSGFDAILIKPCAPNVLVAKVRHLLRHFVARPSACHG
jgi:DNA-binding response OmpR family regulator